MSPAGLFPLLLIVLMTSTSSSAGPVRAPLPSAEEIGKLPPDGGAEFNRLIFEQSPYLLQHARNPVDWYPWGEEAFAKAKAENKPIFLSIGYTTCHWCHVMEHESFEDEEVAEAINAGFVAIKVDREERPDIDEVYMTVTQAMTGSGGWPMTVILSPDKKPFFAGTYFPKSDAPGRTGLMTILGVFRRLWSEQQEKLLAESDRVVAFLRDRSVATGGDLPGAALLEGAYAHFLQTFDPKNAGFGGAPKFPVPSNLSFLVRHHQRTGEAPAMDMVERTLTAMRLGGIYDQIGFGVHRYSTDRVWLVPHFEKMLYDQALFVLALTDAYQAGGNPFHAATAREVLDYVLRDLTAPEGGFYSAEDADSEGREGTFYLWTPQEIVQVLGESDGTWFNELFQILPEGNYQEEARRVKTGENIPHLREPISPDLRERAESARRRLFAHREQRVHPQKDDKVLTDWNGLMIAALARAAVVLDSDAYRDAAKRAADFALTRLRREDGRLLKRHRAGQSGLSAHLEDYAFLVWGMIEVYQATFEPGYLRAALELTETMDAHFWDAKGGGYFMTADDSEELLVRSKTLYGGAIPSGNAVASLNLVRLHRLTGRPELGKRADDLLRAFGQSIAEAPHAFPVVLQTIDFLAGPTREVVISGERGDPAVQELLATAQRAFRPNQVVLFRPAEKHPEIAQLVPFLSSQEAIGGKATAYVCENFACQLPVHTSSELETLLSGRNPKP
ncbi:MAG: hypothetical protein DVB23_002694 [Verrucomicrobia bacterium]|nr:MAG: hypothetical protein DVB23_002694 [Verrucomicrobiota bacterium]